MLHQGVHPRRQFVSSGQNAEAVLSTTNHRMPALGELQDIPLGTPGVAQEAKDGTVMNTQGEIEAAIRDGISRFEQDYDLHLGQFPFLP
jgi:hypothetical protein